MEEEPKLELKIEKVIEEKVVTVSYDRDFIENQIVNITAQRNEQIELMNAELTECKAILKRMDDEGIISKEQYIKEVEDANKPERIITI